MADTRLAGADFVRAFACLMVVGHHVAQRVDPAAFADDQTWMPMAVTMGAFGVAAFFVLSGYLLARPFWLALDAKAVRHQTRRQVHRSHRSWTTGGRQAGTAADPRGPQLVRRAARTSAPEMINAPATVSYHLRRAAIAPM